jgi:hypothetical protein
VKIDWKKILQLVLQILIGLPLAGATDEEVRVSAENAVLTVQGSVDAEVAVAVDWKAVIEEVVIIIQASQRLIGHFKSPEASI